MPFKRGDTRKDSGIDRLSISSVNTAISSRVRSQIPDTDTSSCPAMPLVWQRQMYARCQTPRIEKNAPGASPAPSRWPRSPRARPALLSAGIY
ncbi:Uncharacterised protein [Mycobacteroides abscessus subsp. abscessus]|nr:Uncharacterised protein [Mycobacteroides abscessus subsp. abscessus]